MYILINDFGDYKELPYAQSEEDAERELSSMFAQQKIKDENWVIINDRDKEE